MHCLPALRGRETEVGQQLYDKRGLEALKVTEGCSSRRNRSCSTRRPTGCPRSRPSGRHHRNHTVKVAVALGGNALLQPDSDIQESHVASALDTLTPVLRGHDVVITHSNGPQLGVLALESGSDPALSRPYLA
jgi:hypothetical protein